MKNKILVTGGLGFIGSHTAVKLIHAGYEICIIDDLSNAQSDTVDRIHQISNVKPAFRMVDMKDFDALHDFFSSEQDIKAVIHFAAHKAVAESTEKPEKYFRNNILSLINLIDCMEMFNVKNLLFSSSATVYGEPDSLPLTEEAPVKKAASAYGSTKQIGEEIIEKIAATGRIRALSLRYFNPVGAHPSGLLGELPLGIPNNLMPYITQVAAGLRGNLVVYGNDYPTPDGTCIRDYIHVMDLAEAHVAGCEYLLSDKQSSNYDVFNIGTGNGVSVMEMIHAFQEYNQLTLPYTIGPKRNGDVPVLYADVSKAESVLNWKAKSGIKEMVMSAWSWQQQVAKSIKI
ncbi:MAG: UDP-glucose 4-epimerase GalE [Bacteroidota bacterium]